jgi:hypothetical protein
MRADDPRSMQSLNWRIADQRLDRVIAAAIARGAFKPKPKPRPVTTGSPVGLSKAQRLRVYQAESGGVMRAELGGVMHRTYAAPVHSR